MEKPENAKVVYEFGRFVLDPNEKTLFSDGAPIRLTAKEFETLLLLVQNNGRALSKERMMASIWEDAFVDESNLAKQISRLRKILNKNGSEFIETLPKHGYRFSADLQVVEPDANDLIIAERRTVKRLRVPLPVGYEDRPDNKLLLKAHGGGASWWKRVVAVAVLLGGVTVLIYWTLIRESDTAPPVLGVRSVAVLPFRYVGNENDDYLRLGLSDAVITKLSALQQIVVRPTSAVRKYEADDPLKAGRELRVDAVLDGNVQRIGNEVRVTVQLVNVADGRLLWGRTFDEDSTDIFTVQDAISEQVAAALAPGLTSREKSLLAKRYTTNPDAHHAYVRGRYFWNKRTAADLEQAVIQFKEAISKDPNYALAYAGLADSYNLLPDYHGESGPEVFEAARAAAEKALSLDSELAEAHTSLAYVRMYRDWDWHAAADELQRSIAINPNYATAHHWYSEYLSAMGRFDEALAEIRRAKEIDPLSPMINAGEVWILYYARRYDEAIELGIRLKETNPQFAEVREILKRCYDQKGMYREAITERQARRKLVGLDSTETPPLKRAAAARDHESYWRGRLEQEIAELPTEPPSAFDFAEIYAQLGDKDKAYEWLERAVHDRLYPMMYLKVSPNLDPLRGDARFAELLKRVRLDA